FSQLQNRKSTMSACCLRRRCIVVISFHHDGVMLSSWVRWDTTPGGIPRHRRHRWWSTVPWEGTAMLPVLRTWWSRDIVRGDLVTRRQEEFDHGRHGGARLVWHRGLRCG